MEAFKEDAARLLIQPDPERPNLTAVRISNTYENCPVVVSPHILRNQRPLAYQSLAALLADQRAQYIEGFCGIVPDGDILSNTMHQTSGVPNMSYFSWEQEFRGIYPFKKNNYKNIALVEDLLKHGDRVIGALIDFSNQYPALRRQSFMLNQLLALVDFGYPEFQSRLNAAAEQVRVPVPQVRTLLTVKELVESAIFLKVASEQEKEVVAGWQKRVNIQQV